MNTSCLVFSSSGPITHSVKRLLFILLLMPLFAGVSLAQDAAVQTAEQNGKHMLWRISSDAGTEGYLVGSVHLMKPDAYPLSDVFDGAFAASDLLVFEVDQDSMAAQAQQLTMRLGLYPEGKTLQSELSAETYAALEAITTEMGLPLAQMQRLEPWMVALTIPVVQMQKAGYNPQSGIDAYFFQKAKEADKERRAFETTEEQLSFFDSLPPEEQEAFLSHGLAEAGETVKMIDEMVRYWKAGDADALDRVLQGAMRKDFPALYQTLLVERNQNWMPEITKLLDAESVPMIVVGAGHVVGEEGLKAMLEAQGHRVEQQ